MLAPFASLARAAHGAVNIFVSEGAFVSEIVKELENCGNNDAVVRDAFGHVKIDSINTGDYFAKKFKKTLNPDKVLIQKSGYFARSGPPLEVDKALISSMASLAVSAGLSKTSGLIGCDVENENERVEVINFERVRGGGVFDTQQGWWQELIREVNAYGA